MVLPLRTDGDPFEPNQGRPSPREHRFDVGGEVGEMHADLAERLARQGFTLDPLVPTGLERTVRTLSKAAGLLALVAGYAVAMLLLFR